MFGEVAVELAVVSDHSITVVQQEALFSMHVSHLRPSIFQFCGHAFQPDRSAPRLDVFQTAHAHPSEVLHPIRIGTLLSVRSPFCPVIFPFCLVG